MRIVLVGSIGRFPVAGHAWVNLQYLLGFRSLGHDVYYLEDAGPGTYVYDWQRQEIRNDLAYPTGFIRRALEPYGFGNQWCYRSGQQVAGLTQQALLEICRTTDLFLIRGAPLPLWRDEYGWPRRRAFLDVDPLFTQAQAATGHRPLCETIDNSEILFTIAQRMGASDCHIPDLGRHWHRTCSPIYLPEWPYSPEPSTNVFTTIMQWSAYQSVKWEGREYGNKQKEFPRFCDIARKTDAGFCVAMTGRPPEHVDTRGWQIIDGMKVSSTLKDYRHFIQTSLGEFAVAKHGYVASRGGWFSDRSVCYLASGRPVIVQDTGLAEWLPIGGGIISFRTPEEATTAIQVVQSDYDRHRRDARQLAENYFATEMVLPDLLAANDSD